MRSIRRLVIALLMLPACVQARDPLSVFCATQLNATPAALAALLPQLPEFEHCMVVDSWGQSAGAAPGTPGGAPGVLTVEAFTLSQPQEDDNTNLLRSRSLNASPLAGVASFWRLRASGPSNVYRYADERLDLGNARVGSVRSRAEGATWSSAVTLMPLRIRWQAWFPSMEVGLPVPGVTRVADWCINLMTFVGECP